MLIIIKRPWQIDRAVVKEPDIIQDLNETYKKDEEGRQSYANRNKRSTGSRNANDRKNFDQQILEQKVAEKNDFSNKRNRDRMNKDKMYKDKALLHDERRKEHKQTYS